MLGTTIILDGIGHVLADSDLRVPVYQRSFSWGPEEINDLLSDLWESFRGGDAEYFLGSIVLTGAKGERPSVVDGQQRLASISMIYAVIRDILHSKGDRRSTPLSNKYLFSLNFKTEEIEPKLQLNESDNDFFRKYVLSEPDSEMRSITPNADSHKRIKAAFYQIKERVVKYADASPQDSIGVLIDWADYLEKNVKVILVSVPDEANAFIIFETLNDRGLDLSIADLLKNYIFGKSETRIEESRTNWLKAIAALEGSGGDRRIATFIRHFWASKQGPVRERELYGNLKKKIKTKQAAVDFSIELSNNARLYAAILNSDHELWIPLGSETRQHVQTLLNLRLEQYRPLLLACLESFSPKELRKILKLLVSWNVRFLIVGGLGSGTMEKYYANGGKKVRDKEITLAGELAKYFLNYVPDDSQFEVAFSNARVTQNFLARYYLQALERSMSGEKNPELVPNTLEKDVDLEHILPQHPKMGEWANFDEECVKANHSRLGNLTLMKSGENKNVGNKPFPIKKAAYAASKFKLNQDLTLANEWTEEAIAKRQFSLAKIAVKTWPLKA